MVGVWNMKDKQFDLTNCFLGIELGSTRIKAVLIDKEHNPIAAGSHMWENKLENGVWTYSLDDIWNGLRACYADLAQKVQAKFDLSLTTVGSMGVSAMMHGYIALDRDDRLLVPFRTWRNTITGEAAEKLTEALSFNIPQRWSIAHLYQVMLNKEPHIKDIAHLTTLAGYIHYMLTGVRAIGIGEASGMFPIDSRTGKYDAGMLEKFDALAKDMPWKIHDILPAVLIAGEKAGALTEKGALLLDPTGTLKAGIPLCPAEGDAGTGMVATNSVLPRTGNVSAGTSVFLMAVLEKPLSKVYPEIDMVTTPCGDPVAMVHCNNCSSDIDAWVGLFKEALGAFGAKTDADTLYNTLFAQALSGDADCGGLLAYNYLSGESVTGFDEGRPLFARLPDARFTLANFMRVQLFTACGALRVGMNTLNKESVTLDSVTGHGGFFKVQGVGQRIMAAALNTPVTVMATAGEGGPWGMAILAAYMQNKRGSETLADYLRNRVFQNSKGNTVQPDKADTAGFAAFMERYIKGLAIEHAAVEGLNT